MYYISNEVNQSQSEKIKIYKVSLSRPNVVTVTDSEGKLVPDRQVLKGRPC
jgi:hypothetical protein